MPTEAQKRAHSAYESAHGHRRHSIRLPADLNRWAEDEAAARGLDFSAFVRGILEAERDRAGE